jgi:hypothetical protein
VHIVNYTEALEASFRITGWEKIGLYTGFKVLGILIDPTFWTASYSLIFLG